MSFDNLYDNRRADFLSSFICMFIKDLFKKKKEDICRYIEAQEEFSDSFWKGLPVTKQEFLDAIPSTPISVFCNDVYYTHEEDYLY